MDKCVDHFDPILKINKTKIKKHKIAVVWHELILDVINIMKNIKLILTMFDKHIHCMALSCMNIPISFKPNEQGAFCHTKQYC
jgi:hypothetical protein